MRNVPPATAFPYCCGDVERLVVHLRRAAYAQEQAQVRGLQSRERAFGPGAVGHLQGEAVLIAHHSSIGQVVAEVLTVVAAGNARCSKTRNLLAAMARSLPL